MYDKIFAMAVKMNLFFHATKTPTLSSTVRETKNVLKNCRIAVAYETNGVQDTSIF